MTSPCVVFVVAYLRLSLMFAHCNGRVHLGINVFVYSSHNLSPVVFGGQIVQRHNLKFWHLSVFCLQRLAVRCL